MTAPFQPTIAGQLAVKETLKNISKFWPEAFQTKNDLFSKDNGFSVSPNSAHLPNSNIQNSTISSSAVSENGSGGVEIGVLAKEDSQPLKVSEKSTNEDLLCTEVVPEETKVPENEDPPVQLKVPKVGVENKNFEENKAIILAEHEAEYSQNGRKKKRHFLLSFKFYINFPLPSFLFLRSN